jgi:hypothetical protein
MGQRWEGRAKDRRAPAGAVVGRGSGERCLSNPPGEAPAGRRKKGVGGSGGLVLLVDRGLRLTDRPRS